MTISDIEILANNGDVNAMMTLAIYHINQHQADEAEKWAYMAADRNDIRAIRLAVILKQNEADAIIKLTGNRNEACDEMLKAWDYYCKGLDHPDLEGSVLTDFLKLNENDSLTLKVGYGLTRANRCDEGINFMSPNDKDPRFAVLIGICYTTKGVSSKPVRVDYMEKGYLYLRVLDNCIPEIPSDALYRALGYLETDYLQADNVRMKTVRTDITAAYNCACKIASLPGWEAEGRERLSHYRKKTFGGGYMYVK